jgi:hypothetical protein
MEMRSGVCRKGLKWCLGSNSYKVSELDDIPQTSSKLLPLEVRAKNEWKHIARALDKRINPNLLKKLNIEFSQKNKKSK